MTSYKLLSYLDTERTVAGVLVGERVFDAGALLGLPAPIDMLALLDGWTAWREAIPAALAKTAVASKPLSGLSLAAPIPEPRTLFCAGANYADHVAEMRTAANTATPSAPSVEAKPWHFMKHTGSVVGPGAAVALPALSQKVDWEAELAVVIGLKAQNVSVKDALKHVMGYTIANDLSARDLSRRPEAAPDSPFRYDWLAHKSFAGACPLGPWITPASDIADPQALAIRLELDGETMQDSNTAHMISSIAEQISHLSSVLTLRPGDVILTGTPSGVGMGRGRFLKPGETIRIAVEGIGELTHTIA